MSAATFAGSPRAPAMSRRMLLLPLPPAALIAAMALLLVAVPPASDFPIADDWLYARMVKSLVELGQLQISPWSATTFVLQAYWGALFVQLFGFSHSVLRASTLLLGAVGVLAFYLLLRELLDRWRALLGALLLLVNPLYVHLSYTFLTDIPFLALALCALVCYVRALRCSRFDTGWLIAGSALAGGAYLVRQLGLALPLAALGGLLLAGPPCDFRERSRWRAALRPRYVIAVLGPFLPALIIGTYFHDQRGPASFQPLAFTLATWSEHGPVLPGLLLTRLAGTFSTLGLFVLPLFIGALAGRSTPNGGWQRRLAAGSLLLLLAGFIARGAIFGLGPLFPHVDGDISSRGFEISPRSGSVSSSIAVPESGLIVVTVAAFLGAGLLALGVAAALARGTRLGPAAVPLLFGLFALALTVAYDEFLVRYLVVLLPAAVLMVLLTFRGTARTYAPALAGVALLAAWSVWWEREYLERRAAFWQAGQALVARGIAPEDVESGYEWNGWYRGEAAIAAATQQAAADGDWHRLDEYVLVGLHLKKPRWAVVYSPPGDVPGGRVLTVVSYGQGQRAVGVQRP